MSHIFEDARICIGNDSNVAQFSDIFAVTAVNFFELLQHDVSYNKQSIDYLCSRQLKSFKPISSSIRDVGKTSGGFVYITYFYFCFLQYIVKLYFF